MVTREKYADFMQGSSFYFESTMDPFCSFGMNPYSVARIIQLHILGLVCSAPITIGICEILKR